MPGLTTSAKSSSRTPFQAKHVLKFGLMITQVDAASKRVLSVRCQFCVYFGKEEVAGSKRQRQQTENVKTWETFRGELYEKHHVGQHKTHWEAYQVLSADEKKTYFDNVAPFANTIHRHFGRSNDQVEFDIILDIVENIIGDVFFDAASQGGVSHTRALALFKPQFNDEEEFQGYKAIFKNALQFSLIVKYLEHGLSFRQAAAVLESTKTITGVGKVGSVSDAAVANVARILVAVNLQTLHDILESKDILGFSLAFDSSTHRGVSYLACRVRFAKSGCLLNLHMFAVPMFDRHTAENMFLLIVKILDNLCPSWKMKLIGVGSDGANVMTGRLGGVVTLFEREAEFHIYRTWCLLHQIDLIAKAKLNDLFEGKFISSINKISFSLRKQETLIREMGGVKCPKMTTRWLALGSWSKWQLTHREELQRFFATRNANQVKPEFWHWPVVAAISAFFYHVDITIKILQDRTLLMHQQSSELQRLIERLVLDIEVDGPLSEEQMADREDYLHEFSGPWSITYQAVREFIEDQGLWVTDLMDELSDEEQETVIEQLGKFIVGFIEGISHLSALRNSENQPKEDDIPPILPHQLCQLRGRDFGKILTLHRQRIERCLGQSFINRFEADHTALRQAYLSEKILKQNLDACTESTSYQNGWKVVEGRFATLRTFAGAFASIFPNTASVESDFSVLGWEKDEFRQSLTDLALEGIMQAKQFQIIQKLK